MEDEAQLRHDIDSLATQFEMIVRRRGSDPEAFEHWREAFYDAFDHPQDETAASLAHVALDALLSAESSA